MIEKPAKNKWPWRPYQKKLNQLQETLFKKVEPAPFEIPKQVADWVGNLRFPELMLCDSECRDLSKELKDGVPSDYEPILGSSNIRWQLILRCECAMDFCRGKVRKKDRDGFNWEQNPEIVIHWLLLGFWRRNGIHWAHKIFGSEKTRRSMQKHYLTSDLFYRLRKTDPTKN